jgi:hypothetical protein
MNNMLNELIAQTAYTLDCLMLLREIQQSGDCNTCDRKECACKPKAGQMVRYNCPFYSKKEEGRK